GSVRSYHLSGNAYDFTGSPAAKQSFIQSVKAQHGDSLTELIDEGDHVHVAWKGESTGRARATRTASPSSFESDMQAGITPAPATPQTEPGASFRQPTPTGVTAIDAQGPVGPAYAGPVASAPPANKWKMRRVGDADTEATNAYMRSLGAKGEMPPEGQGPAYNISTTSGSRPVRVARQVPPVPLTQRQRAHVDRQLQQRPTTVRSLTAMAAPPDETRDEATRTAKALAQARQDRLAAEGAAEDAQHNAATNFLRHMGINALSNFVEHGGNIADELARLANYPAE